MAVAAERRRCVEKRRGAWVVSVSQANPEKEAAVIRHTRTEASIYCSTAPRFSHTSTHPPCTYKSIHTSSTPSTNPVYCYHAVSFFILNQRVRHQSTSSNQAIYQRPFPGPPAVPTPCVPCTTGRPLPCPAAKAAQSNEAVARSDEAMPSCVCLGCWWGWCDVDGGGGWAWGV